MTLSKLNFPISVDYGYGSKAEELIISDKNGNKIGGFQSISSNQAVILDAGGGVVYKSIDEPINSTYETKYVDKDKTIGYSIHGGLWTFKTHVKLFKNDVHCYTIKDSNFFMWLVRIIFGVFIPDDDDEVPDSWLTPTYKVLDKQGTEILRISRSKNPVYDKFRIERVGRINGRDEGLILCGILEMIYVVLMAVE